MSRSSKVLLGWIIAGIIGGGVFIKFYKDCFPQLNVDLKVNKKEAESISLSYLRQQGIKLDNYEKTSIFSSDIDARFYLEKYYPLQKVNELIKTKIPVWYWEIRWFKPLVKEEYKVFIDPLGKIKGFICQVEENAKGENLSLEEAIGIASEFLAKQNITLSSYNLIQSSSQIQKARTDHLCVWEKKHFNLKDATFQLKVKIIGDRIGEFNQYLHIPEKYIRKYEKYTSCGSFVSMCFFIFTLLLYILSLVIVIRQVKNNELKWHFIYPIVIIIGFLFVLEQINSLDIFKSMYSTEVDMTVYLGTQFVSIITMALFGGIIIFLTGCGGDALVRDIFKEVTPPSSMFRLNWLLSKEYIHASIRGYSLAFIWLGYIVIFYISGKKFFGLWIPSAEPYSNILSTTFPLLYPLTIGFSSAFLEEFVYRLFAISLLRKYIHSTFLAIIIPAVIWAFQHSSYVVFPIYIRGIELTVIGIILGYTFIKYGLMTTIIAHYVVNALILSLPLLEFPHPYFIISGIITVGLGFFPILLRLMGKKNPTDFSGQ